MAVIVGLQAAVTGRDRDPAETAAQSPAVAAKMPVSTQSGASMRTLLPILLLVSVACRTDPAKLDTAGASDDTGPELVDADGDGYDESIDCDDEDASIHPGADEQCDGLDNDCDGDIDEEGGSLWYADGDGDGYGDPEDAVTACEAPSGFVGDSSDCDDGDPEVHPDAPERCDGLDNDCDGEIDEDLAELWHIDADGDGFGDPDLTIDSCDPGEGWVEPAMATDCDDGDAAVNPDAEEVCNGVDDDCDGAVDEDLESTFYADADGDGFGDPDAMLYGCEPAAGYTTDASDCDDANSGIHPDADELCDTLDNDCDGLIDDADPSIGDASTWYTDADGDGYGDDGSSTTACEQPSGTAALGGDCDDADPAYNPGAVEDDCTDPNDYNCDGSTGYADDDGDGWAACEDCDDTDAAVSPDGTEVCNGVDDDCDGAVDEDDAADASTWYADADGDGYGDAASTDTACSAPSGYVGVATDCDDGDATVNPAAAEACNGVDDDCDGSTDEGVLDSFYADADGDGYGDAGSAVEDCTAPSGYVADDADCDDGDAAVNPAASEACNGVDDDCDGTVDEADAADAGTWYQDLDGDGYGDAAAATVSCDQPSGYVGDATDCDDGDGAVNPAATELCDAVDNDCDGTVDEDDADDASTWYADADGDGYGDAGDATTACNQPSGTVADSTDCDDGDTAVNPAGVESCDGIDNDCDGTVDEDDAVDAATWYADGDGDGYGDASSPSSACSQPSGTVADSTDCDDVDAAVNPAASEICNGVDDDCDGAVDGDDASVDTSTGSSWYADADGDGYGDAGSATEACSQPTGTVADATDCDDGDAAINPGEDELCNGVDDDCDGSVDEDGAADGASWYADADGDGYGDAGTTTTACSQPSGYVADDADCDDGDASVSPSATETCDGVDQDCSGSVSWLEVDADGDGLMACELSLWLRSDSDDNNDPSDSGSHGSSEAAAQLAAEGLDFDTAELGSTSVTAALLDDYGLLVMNGQGDDGPLSAAEAAVLEDWVRDGGSLLYIAYHPSSDTCAMVDSLPSAFGIGCAGYGSYWSATVTSISAHDLTTGVGSIVGMGGEYWSVTSPAATLADTSGWPVLAYLELEDGRVVGVSDEWFLYNAGTGSADISQGDNEQLVENIWGWLGEFVL